MLSWLALPTVHATVAPTVLPPEMPFLPPRFPSDHPLAIFRGKDNGEIQRCLLHSGYLACFGPTKTSHSFTFLDRLILADLRVQPLSRCRRMSTNVSMAAIQCGTTAPALIAGRAATSCPSVQILRAASIPKQQHVRCRPFGSGKPQRSLRGVSVTVQAAASDVIAPVAEIVKRLQGKVYVAGAT